VCVCYKGGVVREGVVKATRTIHDCGER
jgi:hypothetical protein